MKRFGHYSLTAIIFLLAPAFHAVASETPSSGSSSLLVTMFVGFFTLILVFQIVPACLLFFSMLRGLFTSNDAEEKAFNTKKPSI